MGKQYSVRDIPDGQLEEMRIWAAEEKTSINSLILRFIDEAIKGRVRSEKKRLTKRLNDLNQEKLI